MGVIKSESNMKIATVSFVLLNCVSHVYGMPAMKKHMMGTKGGNSVPPPPPMSPTPMDPAGYKQVNALLTSAYMQIIKDGQYERIQTYNGGFGGGFVAPLADPDTCTRGWNHGDEPVGILAEAVETGEFKWCFTDGEFGDVELGLIGVAEEDNFLQGVKTGDYYGIPIDEVTTVTLTMSLILGKPLCPVFYRIPSTDAGVFYDTVAALEANECYASHSIFYRHPYREAVADYTCNIGAAGVENFAIISLYNGTDLTAAVENEGEGLTICTYTGSIQELLLDRSFSKATKFEVVTNSFVVSLCDGTCDAVVDDVTQFAPSFNNTLRCNGLAYNTVAIASPSSGGGSGAITFRPQACAAN